MDRISSGTKDEVKTINMYPDIRTFAEETHILLILDKWLFDSKKTIFIYIPLVN